ncbi:hypothetical protein BGX38DRAFT_1169653 [Terfezia claveryi]|nr:hypothetical protein BGX38DRAFT_1169653 [Terfezia claveryi]
MLFVKSPFIRLIFSLTFTRTTSTYLHLRLPTLCCPDCLSRSLTISNLSSIIPRSILLTSTAVYNLVLSNRLALH